MSPGSPGSLGGGREVGPRLMIDAPAPRAGPARRPRGGGRRADEPWLELAARARAAWSRLWIGAAGALAVAVAALPLLGAVAPVRPAGVVRRRLAAGLD